MAFAKYAISTRTDNFIGLGGDYDLYGTRYLLRDPNTGTDIPIFEPWRVRPTAMIGVSSDVLAH
jgi:hypothetical protein